MSKSIVSAAQHTQPCCADRPDLAADHHEGRPVLAGTVGKGRYALIAFHCPLGHSYTTIPARDWAGSWLEMKATDPTWTITCHGAIPRGEWR